MLTLRSEQFTLAASSLLFVVALASNLLDNVQELLGSHQMGSTHHNLPVLLVGADLVAGPHLAVGGAAGDEDEDPGHRLGRSLVLLVLVPVAVTVAGGSRPLGVLSLASQEREVVVVELVLDGLLHNVLHHRGPSRHLICVLARSLLPSHLPNLATISICDHIDSKMSDVSDHAGLLWRNLGVLDKFGQILLTDSILRQDVEKDDPDLIVDGDILIQEDGNDVLHVIFKQVFSG